MARGRGRRLAGNGNGSQESTQAAGRSNCGASVAKGSATRLVPALAACAADGEQPDIIHAQKHITAKTRCHAFLGRPKKAARRATDSAADHHAKRPADQKADAHAKPGADQGPRHGIRRAAQTARDGPAGHAQAEAHRTSAEQIAQRDRRCRTATQGSIPM